MTAGVRNILLTGSTGFVGQAVSAELRAAGHRLSHVVRSGGGRGRIGADERVIEVDDLFTQTVDWWSETTQGSDLILHMAWYTDPSDYQMSPKNLECLAGTVALAQGAARANVRRFVGVGTCLEYDFGPPQDVCERQAALHHVSPDSPLKPQSPYAAAKAACGLALGQNLPAAGVAFLWARLFYLYGTGENHRRLVPTLHAGLSQGRPVQLTSGRQIRDFLNVETAAKLLVEDALSERCGVSNICSGHGITVRALAEQIADQYGRRDLLQFGTRPENPDDPPCVIGERTESLLKGHHNDTV